MSTKPIKKKTEDFLPLSASHRRVREETGLVSMAFGNQVICDTDPDLFDITRMSEGETAIIKEITEIDEKNKVTRNNKRVKITPGQTRILFILNFDMTRNGGLYSDDIRAAIENPLVSTVHRQYLVSQLTKMIYKKTGAKFNEKILAELAYLSKVKQIAKVKVNGEPYTLIDSFIDMGGELKSDLEETNGLHDRVTIGYHGIFFISLNNKNLVLTKRMLDVWSEAPYANNEVFTKLLIKTLTWYGTQGYINARNVYKKWSKEAKEASGDRLKEIEQQEIMEVRAALTYRLNAESLKEKIDTGDYDTRKQYRSRFRTKIMKAIEGFIKGGLAIDGHIEKGAKDQDVIVIEVSDSYGRGIWNAEYDEQPKCLPE